MPNFNTILSAIKIVCFDIVVDAAKFAAYATIYDGMFITYCLFQAVQK